MKGWMLLALALVAPLVAAQDYPNGGQVDFMCDQTTNTVPQIKSGNVKAYAVTTTKRLPSLPDVPTLALQAAVQDPAFRSRLAELGAEPVPVSKATPDSLRGLLKSEVDKWGPIIRKTGVFAD
jgi:tripartite-type tricarboxylate transporter receptor subunit TctC